MNKEEFHSDSDLSDEDYIPDKANSDIPSEEESDGEPEDNPTEEENCTKQKGSKRKRKNQRKEQKKKSVIPECKTNDSEKTCNKNELTEEDQKKHEESLWADFMKDTDTVHKQKSKSVNGQTNNSGTNSNSNSKHERKESKEEKVTITEIFDFVGEKVEVTKEVKKDSIEVKLASSSKNSQVTSARGKSAGFSLVLGQLGKKNKISTLEKSKLDWEKFKSTEGIKEDLETFNKGKKGYLEQQDFLQRTDLRQFEIEKQMRTKTRRSNI